MAEPKKDAPSEAVQKTVDVELDVELEQGFRGVEVDPTPNENYTLAGVNAGKPTPETDDKAAADAAAAVRSVGQG